MDYTIRCAHIDAVINERLRLANDSLDTLRVAAVRAQMERMGIDPLTIRLNEVVVEVAARARINELERVRTLLFGVEL